MSESETISSHTLIKCQQCGKYTNAKNDQAWVNMEQWLAEVTRQRDELLKACQSVVADCESSKGEVFLESVRLCEKAIAAIPDTEATPTQTPTPAPTPAPEVLHEQTLGGTTYQLIRGGECDDCVAFGDTQLCEQLFVCLHHGPSHYRKKP
jgi:hypothetical protein